MSRITLALIISIALFSGVTYKYLAEKNGRRNDAMLHNNQMASVVDGKHRVQSILTQTLVEYKQQNKWAIDSAKKAGIKEGRIVSITNGGIRIKYRDTVLIKDSLIYLKDTSYSEYRLNADTSCVNFGFYTNTLIYPKAIPYFNADIEWADVKVKERPERWFWTFQWRKRNWPEQTYRIPKCGELFKNTKSEIK
jgi:hypothetical protein